MIIGVSFNSRTKDFESFYRGALPRTPTKFDPQRKRQTTMQFTNTINQIKTLQKQFISLQQDIDNSIAALEKDVMQVFNEETAKRFPGKKFHALFSGDAGSHTTNWTAEIWVYSVDFVYYEIKESCWSYESEGKSWSMKSIDIEAPISYNDLEAFFNEFSSKYDVNVSMSFRNRNEEI